MRRRDFSQAAMLSCATVTLGGVSAQALAQPTAFKEGTDYYKLGRPAPVDAPADKVEVVEFFGYWCPHCARFEPAFDAWMKKAPAHMAVRRVPVAFRDDNVPLQRLYYVLEAMGKVEELHGTVFTALHVERVKLNTQDDIAAWLVKQGVDKTKFLEFYNSFSVAGKARRATQITEAYQVDGVPGMGVAGKYFTSGSLAKSMDRALAVVEHLAQLGRKA